MIKLSDGKIGKREFLSIVMFSIGIKFADTTPDLLFQFGKNAAWMVPIFSMFMLGIPFLILLLLIKKYKLGLTELLFALTGKYIGFVLCFAMFVIVFMDTAVNTRSYVDIVNAMYFQRTPIPYLLLMLLAVSFYIANRGFESIGRTAWIVLPYIQVIILLLVVFVLRDSDVMHIFPIAGPGMYQIIRQSAAHSAVFGEIILLAAFFPFVRGYKDFRFASIVGFTIACLQVAFFCAIYVFVYDYPAVRQLLFPFHQLARTATIGQSVTNVEAVFFFFWVISSAVRFSILLYMTVFLFGKLIRLKEFEPLLPPMTGFIFLLGLLPDNVVVANAIRERLLNLSSVFLIALPFLLFLIDRWKGRVQT
jgi:spore germination protein KB